jgi:hypothetical protein
METKEGGGTTRALWSSGLSSSWEVAQRGRQSEWDTVILSLFSHNCSSALGLAPIKSAVLKALRRMKRLQNHGLTCFSINGKGKAFPLQAWAGPWGSGRLRLPDFLDFRHYEGGRSSPLHTGRLYTQEFSWYSFLEAESTPGHMVPSVASEKIPSDTTGYQSRDPPTSSAVP